MFWHRLQSIKRFSVKAFKSISLNVREAIFDREGGVLEAVEHVVGQHELVACHVECLEGQAEEARIFQHVEFAAAFEFHPPHGNTIEPAGQDAELLHVVKVECQGRHFRHGHFF